MRMFVDMLWLLGRGCLPCLRPLSLLLSKSRARDVHSPSARVCGGGRVPEQSLCSWVNAPSPYWSWSHAII